MTLDRFSNKNSGKQEVEINKTHFRCPPRNGGGYKPNHTRNNNQKRSRSSDAEVISYMNEFGDKVYKKKKNNNYQRSPKANNYATRVTEDKT